MNPEKLSPEETETLYQKLRSRSLEEWAREDDAIEIHLAAKIAHKSTLEEFQTLLIENEIPPMELSDEEMEKISGGAFNFLNFYTALKPRISAAIPVNTNPIIVKGGGGLKGF